MKCRRWWVIFCLTAPMGLFLLMGADVVFKTIRARDAKVAYDETMKKLQMDFDEKILTAKKNYRARLEGAKGSVMQGGDLNEMNMLQAEMKRLDKEIKDYKDTRPAAGRGLLVQRAQYGGGDKWADVTDLFRNRQRNDALNNIPDLPDPARGKHKILVVEGNYGGKDFVLSFTINPGETFIFGAPSEDLNIGRE